MLPGYHKLANQHALAGVLRRVYIPEPALGVGFAEELRPHALPINLKQDVNTRGKIAAIRTQEDISTVGRGAMFTPEDFPRTGYIGEGISYV